MFLGTVLFKVLADPPLCLLVTRQGASQPCPAKNHIATAALIGLAVVGNV